MAEQRVALVTGGNKGIGLAIVKLLAKQGFTVLLGSRDEGRGTAAVKPLRDEGLDVHLLALDQTRPDSIASAARRIAEEFGRLDVLVNNAGVLVDQGDLATGLDADKLRQTLESNVIGVVAVTRALLPLLRKSPAGRIVNMSSTGGSMEAIIAGDNVFAPAYQLSKAALNAFTALLAAELRGTTTKVNSACPGWVKTDMGGPSAPLSPEQGADTPVWLATLPSDGPTGGFFNSREPVAW